MGLRETARAKALGWGKARCTARSERRCLEHSGGEGRDLKVILHQNLFKELGELAEVG